MFKEKEDWIIEKMEKQKQRAVNLIATHVGTKCAEDFAQVLVSAYQFECSAANRLVNELNLSQNDIYAIDNDYEAFENQYIKDYEHEVAEMQLLDMEYIA